MRYLCAFILASFVISGITVADVQYEDVCLEPSQTHPSGSGRISIDNDVMAMSSWGGVVTVFQQGPSGWEEEDSVFPVGEAFGASLQIKGDTLIVGDPYDNQQAGCAYIFRHIDGSWVQEQKLTPSKAQGHYGNGVATDGIWAMVGPRGGGGGVCLFKFDGSVWNEIEYLRPQDHPRSFGFDMELDGSRLLVGSRGAKARAWVYKLDKESWILEAVLSSTSGIPIGTDVDINGNLAIVGEAELPTGTGGSSFATVFRLVGSEWVEEVLPRYPDFGSKVAIDGDLALVKGGNPRIYRVFQFNGTGWEYTKTLNHSDFGGAVTYFGDCVLQATTAFIGFDSDVCLFTDIHETCIDLNGDGMVGVDELLAVIAAWGTDDADADINNDGIVNVNDLLLVISSWGPCD